MPAVHVTDIRCERARKAAGQRSAWHVHDDWQLEWIRAGQVSVRCEARELTLRSGQALLIPPSLVHRLDYDAPSDYLSIKFQANATPATAPIPITDAAAILLVQAIDLLGLQGTGEPLPMLIAALMTICRTDAPTAIGGDPLVDRALTYIRERDGRRLTADGLARHLGVSRSHLNTRFRVALGHPPKTVIDRHRAEVALRLLQQRVLSPARIASLLDFADAAHFTRFIRRLTGTPPHAHRR